MNNQNGCTPVQNQSSTPICGERPPMITIDVQQSDFGYQVKMRDRKTMLEFLKMLSEEYCTPEIGITIEK